MKKNIKYYLFLILAVFVTSCELPDNVDPKNPLDVSADVLFTQGEIELVDQLGSTSVNLNVCRLLAQYAGEVTYTDESRYNFSDRQIPDAYSSVYYTRVLSNLNDAYTRLKNTPSSEPEVVKNKMAIIEVCSVYAYMLLVDAFGDMPYTEALMGDANSTPKYDDAFTIYKDLIVRINKAITDLDPAFESFGNADLIYKGKPELWKKFAASLKLRIGMRLSDVPAAGSNALITEAIAAGVFTDQAQSAILVYNGVFPYVNDYYEAYELGARTDFCPTVTLVDRMNTLSDPRRAIWFTTVEDAYLGMPYGNAGSIDYGSYSNYSAMMLKDPQYPVIVCDYVEVEFLLAEAAERSLGGLTPADAEAHYNNAILASMNYWGVSTADAAAYLAQPSVAYTTAAGNYKEKIGTQKWFALFDRGDEAWAEWRRLDYPEFNVPEELTYADIPLRMPYPFNENKMNKDNYTAAAAAIGGDLVSTQLFWDVVDSPFLP